MINVELELVEVNLKDVELALPGRQVERCFICIVPCHKVTLQGEKVIKELLVAYFSTYMHHCIPRLLPTMMN